MIAYIANTAHTSSAVPHYYVLLSNALLCVKNMAPCEYKKVQIIAEVLVLGDLNPPSVLTLGSVYL